MVRRPSRLRRGVLLLAVVALTAGCETHELTREPDPPVGPAGWTAIWLAALLCAGVATVLAVRVLAVRVLAGDRPRSPERLVLGGAFTAVSVAGLGAVLFQAATDLRVDQILGGGDCRHIAPEHRPVQIVQLHCQDGGLDLGSLGWVLLVVFALPIAVPVVASAVIALRGDARPYFPTVVAAIATAGATLGGIAALADASTGDGLLLLVLAVVAGTATWCGVVELRRPSALPPPPPGATTVPAGVAVAVPAAPVDRMQAFLIDLVAVYVLGSLLAWGAPDQLAFPALLATAAAYLVGTTAAWGATPGKRALRMQVRRAGTDETPGLGAVALRTGLLFVAPVVAGIAVGSALASLVVWALLLGPLARPERAGLHDLAAGTQVVRRPG